MDEINLSYYFHFRNGKMRHKGFHWLQSFVSGSKCFSQDVTKFVAHLGKETRKSINLIECTEGNAGHEDELGW